MLISVVRETPSAGTLQQAMATALTVTLASFAAVSVAQLCRRERIIWPAVLLVSGALASLLEPLFDLLYGLHYVERNEWHLYTTFGSAQPVWVPIAYLAFYGGASVLVARIAQRRPTMRTVWTLYGAIVLMALAAELTYIRVFHLYAYPGDQPFKVLGYPLFLAFTNAMAALIAGLLMSRLSHHLKGWDQLAPVTIIPMCFAAGLFGCGLVYLSVRHGFEDPPMWLLAASALTVPIAIASTVRLVGRTVVTAERAEQIDEPVVTRPDGHADPRLSRT